MSWSSSLEPPEAFDAMLGVKSSGEQRPYNNGVSGLNASKVTPKRKPFAIVHRNAITARDGKHFAEGKQKYTKL
jgi:hypothetical protein